MYGRYFILSTLYALGSQCNADVAEVVHLGYRLHMKAVPDIVQCPNHRACRAQEVLILTPLVMQDSYLLCIMNYNGTD